MLLYLVIARFNTKIVIIHRILYLGQYRDFTNSGTHTSRALNITNEQLSFAYGDVDQERGNLEKHVFILTDGNKKPFTTFFFTLSWLIQYFAVLHF